MSITNDVYEINYNQPGKCVVFANIKFIDDSLVDLEGVQNDNLKTKKLFKEQLNYDWKIFQDKTSTEMIAIVEDIVQNWDFSQDSCFVCFINSHGNLNTIYGIDAKEVDLMANFIEPFKKCKSLLNKPKLFFIDTCRGNKRMKTIEKNSKQILKGSIVLQESDILIGYATVENYVSHMNSKGSWYIQALCDKIESNKQKNIEDVLKKVNQQITLTEKQVAKFETTFRKNFHFYIQSNYQSIAIRVHKRIDYEDGYYEGENIDDKKDGKGTYIYYSGKKYIGDFKNDKPEGKGIFYNKIVDNDNEEAIIEAGWYVGDFKGGKYSGKGILYYNLNDVFERKLYEGDVEDDLPNGFGTLYFKNGDRCEGNWKDDNRHGFVKSFFSDGTIDEGIWKNDLKHGKSVTSWQNGNKYKGDWKNDCMTGKGTYYWKNGEKYDGDMVMGLRHGHGTFFFNEHDELKRIKYEAIWNNDEVIGDVTLYFANGNIYKGPLK